MRIIRFIDESGAVHHGRVAAGATDAGAITSARIIEGDIFGEHRIAGKESRVAKVLYPIEAPAILGIGANYKALFTSSGKPLPEYPIVFYKLGNSLQNPLDSVVLPRRAIRSDETKYEGELCVVIGKSGKNIAAADALEHVFGYTIANDISGFDWQGDRVGMQWSKGKSFDTYCPVGPLVVTADEIPDPAALRVVTRVDGNEEQNELVAEMCFSVQQIIAFLSAGQTLETGSIILTGSPPGARVVKPGETVAITIDPIGTLTNPVVEE